jgi:hypothetical protein
VSGIEGRMTIGEDFMEIQIGRQIAKIWTKKHPVVIDLTVNGMELSLKYGEAVGLLQLLGLAIRKIGKVE